jgi:hypothetical protein
MARAATKPSVNAPVIELHDTAEGAVQASAKACVAGPKWASMRSRRTINSAGVSTAREGSSTRRTWSGRKPRRCT